MFHLHTVASGGLQEQVNTYTAYYYQTYYSVLLTEPRHLTPLQCADKSVIEQSATLRLTL
ncbi:hypothetical protein E2C01_091578 [Portunus trituberculatus]|uniref:Uncharacterized protein n=1 Tax=Portunus trituberculatus TaxID=210409 RepID=A0A5B7JNZ5_PORTR|nr:hypothetical protein [Portunus trituberculatus]